MCAAPKKPPSSWDMWKGALLVTSLLMKLSQGQVAGLECRCLLQDLPPSLPWLLLCCGSLHSSEKAQEACSSAERCPFTLVDPQPCNQLQQTLLTHEAALHAGHICLLCKSVHRAEDTAASSCRSVLPAAILGWTWTACNWAPVESRAGHREKRKRSDSYHSPQKAELLRQMQALNNVQHYSTRLPPEWTWAQDKAIPLVTGTTHTPQHGNRTGPVQPAHIGSSQKHNPSTCQAGIGRAKRPSEGTR